MFNDPSYPAARPSIIQHMLIMPRVHQLLLAGAIFLAGSGTLGQVVGYFSGSSAPQVQQQDQTQVATAQPAPNAAPAVATDQPAPPEPTLGKKLAPWATRIGFGYVVGFVVGWAFRAFLKIMSLLTMAGAAILGGLSYFHIMNIDFSAVEKKYESDIAWVADQGERAAKTLLNHIPGSASSFAGVFVGFRRKFTSTQL